MEVRRYKEGDEQAILDLFKVSFGKGISLDFWKWRYANNPFTETKMINMMWDSDILVGHYAVSPVDLKVEGEIVKSALSMTTMTHPEYGGKGIFTTLAGGLYKQISEEEKIEAIWGFPNLNSHYGLITKLKWADIGTIPTLCLKSKYFNYFQPVEYRLSEIFSDHHEVLLDKYSNSKVRVDKSVSFLNWRYHNNPINKYYILQTEETIDEHFIVIKIFDSFKKQGFQEIDILENGFGYSLSALKSLIGGIIRFASEQNIKLNSINTWMPIYDKRHVLFEKCMFGLSEHITIFGSRTYTHRADKLLDFRNWSLSMGGSDIY